MSCPPVSGPPSMWGCGLWVGDVMARRRHTPEQIIGELREAGVALAQGLVGGAGLRGLGVMGADVLALA